MKNAQRVTTVLLLLVSLGSAVARAQRVHVVNVVPNSRSNETVNDAEPNIAVNPANLFQMAVSAFTPSAPGAANAPIYVSSDGGWTWDLNPIVPGNNGTGGTGDISLAFGGTSDVLYAGILNGNVRLQLNILRTATYLVAAPMALLVSRANDDQPFVEAITDALGGMRDRVYIGNNDVSQNLTTGRTATVDRSLDAAATAAPAGFAPIRIETRTTAAVGGGFGNQDGPSVRPAMHADGTVYAAYFGWRAFSAGGNTNITDVVVVRDDNWAAGPAAFTALVDPIDRLAGIRIVRGVRVPSLNVRLGQQRIGSSLAIAVDPNNSHTVYVAWADGATANAYTIHVRRSTDAGVTWTADLDSARGATNPSLAINTDGTVALLYQQLLDGRWKTHVKVTDNEFARVKDFLLADFEDRACVGLCGAGPLGDYAEIVAVDRTFYGVFSGLNTPDRANFPNGVDYQRNVDFAAKTLLAGDNVTLVGQSIDPFFFAIAPERSGDYRYGAKVVCGVQTDPLDQRLAPGAYATTINIANSGPTPARIVKSLALTFPPGDEQPGQVIPIEAPVLAAGEAIAVDCNEITTRLFNGVLPAPYIEGSVVIQGSRQLDVTGVYTASANAGGAVTSMAVERFPGHRVEEPAAPPPPPVVIRTGTVTVNTIGGPSPLDLDGIQPFQQGTDFTVGASPNAAGLVFTPSPGARLHVVGLQSLGKRGCQDAPLSAQPVVVDQNSMPVGTYVCVQTDLGRIAEMRFVSSGPFSRMNFEFTLWQAVP